jgi:Fe-S cluster biogenesis protein NfuA/nitrite reductase/ring-hydroxylating ferredoxin subunit
VPQLDKKEFQQRLQKIEGLVQSIESSADPNVRACAIELLQTLMEVHGAGIERMMDMVFENAGSDLIDQFGDDEMVGSLLLLYGLHPLDIETRVLQALDKVRPYLRSHGGNVDLIGVEDGIVRLQLQGSCNGCASSAMTLKLAIEEAIYEAAPDLVALEVEGVVTQPAAFVQLKKAAGSSSAALNEPSGWENVGGLTGIVEGAVQTIEVSGRPILFCRVGENYYAYNDTCPECGQAMHAASLTISTLVCPSCKQRFDVLRAGRGLDKPSLYLEPFPLLIEQGQAKIALPGFR